ncbi:MAG: hypothetical protein JOZ46_08455 [Candidatus Dormibacteraeota bacterium]|nr:hypothetical protein [Candidatus Dormibacteraeota bacterium]MBV9525827.1 hypothetical protein [Candidatus Dormibacteraeota bacterium]
MAAKQPRELAEIVQLQPGRHRTPEDGVCAMELVAWMAGEKHSDHPVTASPVIASFIPQFNDALSAEHRHRLAAMTPRMIDSRGMREQEFERGRLLWNWMIESAVPTWLGAAQRQDLAALVCRHRGDALETVMGVIDVYGHAPVRPVDDHRTAVAVSAALAVSGTSSAYRARMDVSDDGGVSRARRRWEAARTVARAAAWHVAEADCQPEHEAGTSRLWRTAECLRESAFVLLDRLLAVTETRAGEEHAASVEVFQIPQPSSVAIDARDDAAAVLTPAS